MKRTRRGILPSVLALGLVVALGAWALNVESPTVPVKMPDGSTVAFAGMAYGSGAGLTYGRPWQRLLYLVTPAQLRPLVMQQAIQLPPNLWPGSLTLWFHHTPYLPVGDRVGARRVLTVDAHGCPFEWGYWDSGREHRGGYMSACRVRAFSRREPALEHRYLVRTGATEWMQVMGVPSGNPAVGTYPQWQPQPLPQTQLAGGLAVTLEQLRAPAALPPTGRPVPEDRAVMSEVRLQLGGSEAVMKTWRPVELTLADATGNRHQREDLKVAQLDDHQPKVEWKSGRKPGEWTMRLPGGLCAHEDAWKVRVEWSRHVAGGAPDAVWRAPSLVIPAEYKDSKFVLGSGIQAQFGSGSAKNGRRMVVLALRSLPEGQRFRVDATDDRGRPLVASDAGFWDPMLNQTRTREFVFQAPLDSRLLNVRVRAYDTRIVEFLAKPQRP